MNIAKNLVRARKAKGLSPTELADALSVSRSLVHNWEHGGPGPRFDRLPDIARVLDTTVQALLGIAKVAA